MKTSRVWHGAIGLFVVYAVSSFQNCSAVSFSSSASNVQVQNHPCTNASQSFTQPNAQITNKVDIVVVLHNTGSFTGTALQDVTAGLGGFAQNLPAGSDYTLSFVSAINAATDPADSGLAYTVLSGNGITPSAVANALAHPPSDKSGLHGEYGMSALTSALTTKAAANKTAGTLRTGAALAVFFLANEADICGELTPTPADGIGPDKTDDDFATADKEYAEAQRYCTAPAVNPTTTITAIQNYAQANNVGYLVGGVVSTDKAITTGNVELEYGWGYIQLLQTLNANLIIPLQMGSSAIQNGVSAVGTLVGKLFNVKTDFVLSAGTKVIDPNSVVVSVNGTPLSSSDVSFNPASNDVHIANPGTAGGPGASVLVNYCVQ